MKLELARCCTSSDTVLMPASQCAESARVLAHHEPARVWQIATTWARGSCRDAGILISLGVANMMSKPLNSNKVKVCTGATVQHRLPFFENILSVTPELIVHHLSGYNHT